MREIGVEYILLWLMQAMTCLQGMPLICLALHWHNICYTLTMGTIISSNILYSSPPAHVTWMNMSPILLIFLKLLLNSRRNFSRPTITLLVSFFAVFSLPSSYYAQVKINFCLYSLSWLLNDSVMLFVIWSFLIISSNSCFDQWHGGTCTTNYRLAY